MYMQQISKTKKTAFLQFFLPFALHLLFLSFSPELQWTCERQREKDVGGPGGGRGRLRGEGGSPKEALVLLSGDSKSPRFSATTFL
jgi:hypothetical protein